MYSIFYWKISIKSRRRYLNACGNVFTYTQRSWGCKRKASHCIRLSRRYFYFLIARKDIVDYTRLAAISLCFFFPRSLSSVNSVSPCFPLSPPPHSSMDAPVSWFGTVFYALPALLLLEQFGQHRKESEGMLTNPSPITVNALLYTEEYYIDNWDAYQEKW